MSSRIVWPKGRFSASDKDKNHSNEGKITEKRSRKVRRRVGKRLVANLDSFCISYIFRYCLAENKTA